MPAKMNRPHGGLLHLYRHYLQFEVTNPNTVTSPQLGRRPHGFITQVSQVVALPRLDIEHPGFGNQGNNAEILRRCGGRLFRVRRLDGICGPVDCCCFLRYPCPA
jgi:hypothetical protein